jgi:phage baseplate assembly protein W
MTLNDLYHYIGSDLSTSATGDLLSVSDTVRGQQRVLRRLLTNPGDYIFHPEYGAGIAQYIGQLLDIPKITALIQSQMYLEEAVSQSSPPVINVSPISGGITGGIFVEIQYVDAATGNPVNLNFNVNQ